MTDVHFEPTDHSAKPSPLGADTNEALLDSALAEMRRVDPRPPVVVIGGDEFSHDFDWSRANATMAYLARRFDRAFPAAQFVLTLGNEDSPCADYGIVPRSAFLRDTARVWEPLVNRHGAAPAFAATFARDGFYTTRLPLSRTRAVVVDDVFWSPRYRACTAPSGDPAAGTIAELQRSLRASHDRHWLLIHIPPGIDAYSTAHLTHRLVVVPFLDPGPRDALLRSIADPAAHVTLVLAAHTHKFAYRIIGTRARPVPMLMMPSISPIFRNTPAFLTADVGADGTLRDVQNHAYVHGAWSALGGFPALGVARFTGPALVDLHRRLAHSPALRQRFEELYEGGGTPEIDEGNWSTYACAATTFNATAFRACVKEGGISIVTARGVRFAAVAAVMLALLVAVAAFASYRLWRWRA